MSKTLEITKMTLEMPTPLHRAVKSIAGASGESMKKIILEAVEFFVKNKIGNFTANKTENKLKTNNTRKKGTITQQEASDMLKPVVDKIIQQYENNQITEDELHDKYYKIEQYLTEEEADRLLFPMIKKQVEAIENGTEKGISSEEFFASFKS